MVYVLRLANGDSIITKARDVREARDLAGCLAKEAGDVVVAVRPLPRFCIRLSPADSGTLDISQWDDATLDDILKHEYPVLDDAIRSANKMPLFSSPSPGKPVFEQLRDGYKENTEVIREGIRQEQQRLASAAHAEPVAEAVRVAQTAKMAHK